MVERGRTRGGAEVGDGGGGGKLRMEEGVREED